MDVFIKFAVDFLKTLFGSLWSGISGLFMGIFGMFNIPKYVQVFKQYSGDFGALAWILAILTVILVIAAVGATPVIKRIAENMIAALTQ